MHISKKDATAWAAGAKEILSEYGFENSTEKETYLGFQKVSDINTLWATVFFEQGAIFTVFFRFKTPVMPTTGLSGKFNFHSKLSLVESLADLEDHVKEACKML